MNKVVKAFAGFLVVFIAIIVLVPLFVSNDDIVQQISRHVKDATGRTLIVDGDKSLSIVPSLTLTLDNVRLSNMSSGSQADMVMMNKLDIHIQWLSLLRGKLVIDRFVVEQPNILLETDKQGVSNWQFYPTITAETQKATTPSNTPVLPENFDIHLGQVEIIGGRVTFIDHSQNSTAQIEQIDLRLLLSSLQQPLALSGNVSYMNERFTLDGQLDTPWHLINKQVTKLTLHVQSTLVNLTFDGELGSATEVVKGHLALATSSVKNILTWQEQPTNYNEHALNQLNFKTDLLFDGKTLTLPNLEAKLDKLAFTGQSTFVLSSPLQVNMDLDLGVLDLNPYLIDTTGVDKTEAEQSAPVIVWSNDVIDLSPLKQLNARIALNSKKLLFRQIELGENELLLQLNNGNAQLDLLKFNAYQGEGSGSITLTTGHNPYQINSDFSFKGIQANPLLKDAVGFDKLLGQGDLQWNINTYGNSQKTLIEQLGGIVTINLTDGAIKGANLAAIARSAEGLLSGELDKVNLDKEFNDAQKTDFASLLTTLSFSQGVGNVKELSLVNPFIRVSGLGKVDLPKTAVDLQIKTTLIASAQGQQAVDDKKGVAIPIKVTGQFHQVKIRPDVRNVIEDKVKNKLKNKVNDALKSLFK